MRQMIAINKVKAAAARLAEETGCPIEVDVETAPGELGFGLYLQSGWHFNATECHTSLNLTESWMLSASRALSDLAQGVARVTEPAL